MTVGQIVEALVKCDDHGAIPEFTLDDEMWFGITSIDRQADGGIQIEVEPRG